MLPPPVRTLLAWASAGVAVGVVAAVATGVILRAEPDAVRVPEVLVIAPIPFGLVAGIAAGSTVASGRGGTFLIVVALAAALVGGPFAPLAPVPIVFAVAGSRADRRGWRRVAAAVAVVVAVGVGLVGVPLHMATAGALPRGIGLVAGIAVGLLVAHLVLPRHEHAA